MLTIACLKHCNVECAERRGPAIVNAGNSECRRAIGVETPGVVVGHDGINALVEVEDPQAAGRPVDAKHDFRPAASVVRMRDTVSMAEFMKDDSV